jgi:hypothetical protein
MMLCCARIFAICSAIAFLGTASHFQVFAAEVEASAADSPESTSKQPAAGNDRISAAFAKPVDVDFHGASLDRVADWLRSESGFDVSIERSYFEAAEISLDLTFSLAVKQISLLSAIKHLFRDQDAKVLVEHGGLVITAPDRPAVMLAKVYAVADLIVRRDALGRIHHDPETLIDVIQRTTHRHNWDAVGGQGSVAAVDELLVVSQDWETHEAITTLLATLRETIKRQAAGDYSAAALPGRSERDVKVPAALDRKITIKAHNQPLDELVRPIGHAAGISVVLDHQKFKDAGIDEVIRISGEAEGMPVRDALAKLFAARDERELRFDPIDDVLLITTPDRDVQFWSLYPVADLVADASARDAGEALVDIVTSMIAPYSWDATGGPGPVEFLAEWKCILVKQRYVHHREIEVLLGQIRDAREKRAEKDTADAVDDAVELRVYSLSLPGEKRSLPGDEVVRTIREMVEPQTLDMKSASLRAVGDRLLVRHRRSVLAKVAALLDALKMPEDTSPGF